MSAFPIQFFRQVEVTLILDIIKPEERLYENKSLGSEDPYYLFALTSTPVSHDDAMEISGILDWYNDSIRNFLLPNPLKSVRKHNGLYLTTSGFVGSQVLHVAGLPPSREKAVWGGDFVQPDINTKGYRLAFSANSDATGRGTLTLTQPLLHNLPAGTQIRYGDDVNFQVCVKNRNGGEFGVKDAGKTIFDLELMEQL
tara:strand:- start:645 stop:1238 length:594 start_codon:yes stop_codon:yes gene_type:complete